MRPVCCLPALVLLAVSLPVQSQTPAQPAEYNIKRIVFQGTTPYSQPNLEAATGLRPGSAITRAQLQSAAERLMGTGAFNDVQASFDGPVKAIDVIFKVRPADSARLLRASLRNFIWWQPDELASELQKQVPLFDGTVPEAGTLQQDLQTALQQLLATKGIQATVAMQIIPPVPAHPARLIEYQVQSPDIHIHTFTITGASPAFATQADNFAKFAAGVSYNEGLSLNSLQNRLLYLYRNAGYQDASISSFTRTITSTSPSRVEVAVAATIHEGELYHLSTLTWAGSPVMSSEAFNAAAKLHPGDLAVQHLLLQSLANLNNAYHNQGFEDVSIDPHPALDTANHTVAFNVEVVPGPQYHLRTLTTLNLPPDPKRDFDANWKLHAGDIYDASYVTGFLKNNSALLSLASYSASFDVVEDPDNATLDLTITFIKGSGGRSTH